MSVNTQSQDAQLKANLYVAPGQRVDCCARCLHATASPAGHLYCRLAGSVEVAKYGVCAQHKLKGGRP